MPEQVRISGEERFVLCHNPQAAARDATVRARLVARLEEMIADSDRLPATKRAEVRGAISTKPALARLLRTTSGGLLRIDDAATIKAEECLDGTHLLHCSDPSLSAEEIATGYNQLWQIERAWRDMKQVIDLRPVHHRKEEPIRAPCCSAGWPCCWCGWLRTPVRRTGPTCGASLRRSSSAASLSAPS